MEKRIRFGDPSCKRRDEIWLTVGTDVREVVEPSTAFVEDKFRFCEGNIILSENGWADESPTCDGISFGNLDPARLGRRLSTSAKSNIGSNEQTHKNSKYFGAII